MKKISGRTEISALQMLIPPPIMICSLQEQNRALVRRDLQSRRNGVSGLLVRLFPTGEIINGELQHQNTGVDRRVYFYRHHVGAGRDQSEGKRQ